MTKLLILAAALLTGGCASLGYSPEQYKAMPNGAIVCNYGLHVTGTVGGLAVNAPELTKQITAKSRITVKPGSSAR